MGRLCKRVPLDFSWPMKTLWIGYVNPYNSVDCPYCENGYSAKAQAIREEVYPHLKGDYCRVPNPYREDMCYNPHSKEHNMTQDEVDYFMSKQHKVEMDQVNRVMASQFPDAEKITPEIFSKLSLIIFDLTYALDRWMIEYHSEKEGWDSSCPHCHGEGRLFLNDEIKRLHEEFTWVEPPTGEGYQMWEDTSEGSPITPVFRTAEELAEYCEREGVSWFGSSTASKEAWLRVINDSAPATLEVAPGVIMM